jgi:hypothetical protein
LRDIAAGTARLARREPLARYLVLTDARHAGNPDNPDTFTTVRTTFGFSVAIRTTSVAMMSSIGGRPDRFG